MSTPKRVLMVCLGNICRSPMAEGILRSKAEKKGIELFIDSAGTGAWHAGEPPDRRAQETMKAKGIDISGLRARQFQVQDFDDFDYIFVMDSNNYIDVCRLAADEGCKQKVEMILNRYKPASNISVPDPYYGGGDGFKHVYKMLSKACDQIIRDIKNGK